MSREENLLTDIDQNNAGALTATWTPLPSIPSGLESHYHYVIQIQKMTSSGWGDWQDVLTVDHIADRDIYRETTDVTLELDVRYRVRLQAVREHQNLKEGTAVSQVLRIQRVSAGIKAVEVKTDTLRITRERNFGKVIIPNSLLSDRRMWFLFVSFIEFCRITNNTRHKS